MRVEEVDLFMPPNSFKSIAKKVRALLKELQVPNGMTQKVLRELNRRSLAE